MRDRIAKAIMSGLWPGGGREAERAMVAPRPGYNNALDIPYYDMMPGSPHQAQATASRGLGARGMSASGAEEELLAGMAHEGEWARRVRTGEQRFVGADEPRMWEKVTDPAAETAHVAPFMDEHQDALRFLQSSQSIDPWGTQ
jgi:hypothetical protein